MLVRNGVHRNSTAGDRAGRSRLVRTRLLRSSLLLAVLAAGVWAAAPAAATGDSQSFAVTIIPSGSSGGETSCLLQDQKAGRTAIFSPQGTTPPLAAEALVTFKNDDGCQHCLTVASMSACIDPGASTVFRFDRIGTFPVEVPAASKIGYHPMPQEAVYVAEVAPSPSPSAQPSTAPRSPAPSRTTASSVPVAPRGSTGQPPQDGAVPPAGSPASSTSVNAPGVTQPSPGVSAPSPQRPVASGASSPVAVAGGSSAAPASAGSSSVPAATPAAVSATVRSKGGQASLLIAGVAGGVGGLVAVSVLTLWARRRQYHGPA